MNTPLRRSCMARVLKGSHSFTCTPHVRPLMEWKIRAFSFPVKAGPYLPTPEGWKAELAWTPDQVVSSILQVLFGCADCTKSQTNPQSAHRWQPLLQPVGHWPQHRVIAWLPEVLLEFVWCCWLMLCQNTAQLTCVLQCARSDDYVRDAVSELQLQLHQPELHFYRLLEQCSDPYLDPCTLAWCGWCYWIFASVHSTTVHRSQSSLIQAFC